MSDLFSSLTAATRALDAQRYGLDVVGQNMANVNTPGYARRVATFQSVGGAPGSPGGGVDVVGVRALRDRLLDRRLLQEVPTEQRESATAEALSIVEATLGTPGTSIDASLQTFFDSFAGLAEDPTSSIARNNVLLRGANLTANFHNLSASFDDARADLDRHVRGAVEDINNITARIATLNRAIVNAPSSEASLNPRDEQMQLVRQLSELLDVRVIEQERGDVVVSLSNGQPLVLGDNAWKLDAVSTAPTGFAALAIDGTTVTSAVTSGRLGAYLTARDTTVPDYKSRLDNIAYTLSQQVNTLHQAGFDQAGAAGGAFFTPLAGASGAAAALSVAAAVSSDPRKIAAASVALDGDNVAARNVAALATARVLNGGTATLVDGWGDLVYRVGRDAQTATNNTKTATELVGQIDALRDQVSGISLDEEATNMLKFQRAYEANARFFRAVDDSLTILMQTIGR